MNYALYTLVGFLIINILIAHCFDLTPGYPCDEHAPQRVRPDYSTVFFWLRHVRRVHASRLFNVV
jgi:phage gp36-like protein